MNNNYYYQTLVHQGWQCPLCKRILAPFVLECTCQMQNTFITVSTTYTDSKTGGIINDR